MQEEVRRAAERLRALGGDPGDPAALADQPYLVAQLAGDLALDRGVRYDLVGLADAAGIGTSRAAELLGVLGIDPPEPGVVRFTDDDVAVLRTIVDAPARWVREQEVAELLRVIGRTMATTAEASIAYHLRSIEPHVHDLADWVDANHEMATLSRQLGAQLGPIYRHHLRQAIDLQRSVNAGAGRGEILDVAVAFVDLTGFTGMSLDLDLIGLGDVVTRLDVLSTDAARAHRCRVVKLIGDEAMFVGADPANLV
ncbi:MAG: hypothetical protein OES57_18445, partial [Acidimicrobiia bacterium]|nr:hypothetical protein [Acidimicrobiia bacterium]